MKINFNCNQIYELKEIDMNSYKLVFETNDYMNYFKDYDDNELEDYYVENNGLKRVANGNLEFYIYFDDYKDLDNIPYLLYKWLSAEDLLYID